MSIVYIKFLNREDAARAIHEITRHGRVSGYQGGVWGVRREQLTTLDEMSVKYQLATEEEVEAAVGSVHHPVAALP